MHGDDEKFFLACWCTNMASENLIGLVKMYGEDILETVKGCEFHIRDSVNLLTEPLMWNSYPFTKLFGELKEKCVSEALCLLTAIILEAYHAVQHNFKLFLNNYALSVDISNWLDWWHDRHEFILRAFTLKESPSSNLVKVIPAGWNNWDRMSVSLLDVFFFFMLGITY